MKVSERAEARERLSAADPLAARIFARQARYANLLCWIAASILPVYLSMFRVHIGGGILRLADPLAAVLVVGTLVANRNAFMVLFRPQMFGYYAVCAYILIQGLYLNRLTISIKEVLQLFFVLTTLAFTAEYIKRFGRVFLIRFSLMLAVSALCTVGYHLMIHQYVRYKFAGDGRYTFGVLSLVLLLIWRQERWKAGWGFAFAISIAPLIASLERKGFFGVGCVVLVMLGWDGLRRIRLSAYLLVAIALVAALPVLVALAGDITNKFHALTAANYFLDEQMALSVSNMQRQALLLNGFDIFSRNWLFGTGADSVREEMRRYFSDVRLANGAHNAYLDTLIKYGVIGGGMFFVTMAGGIYASLSSTRFNTSQLLFTAYMLFVIAFMSESTGVTYMTLMPGFCAGLFLSRPDEYPTRVSSPVGMPSLR